MTSSWSLVVQLVGVSDCYQPVHPEVASLSLTWFSAFGVEPDSLVRACVRPSVRPSFLLTCLTFVCVAVQQQQSWERKVLWWWHEVSLIMPLNAA
jgi:hypothetical protein